MRSYAASFLLWFELLAHARVGGADPGPEDVARPGCEAPAESVIVLEGGAGQRLAISSLAPPETCPAAICSALKRCGSGGPAVWEGESPVPAQGADGWAGGDQRRGIAARNRP
jgi:hypothetical protein